MQIRATSPVDGSTLAVFEEWTGRKVLEAVEEVARAQTVWREESLALRCEQLGRVASLLHNDRAELARLITLEVGKLQLEARAEIDACIEICEHYAEHGAAYLDDQPLGNGSLQHLPLGNLLVILPRYAPFLDTFRNVIPALLAGNGVLLKLSTAVSQCALAIEELFREACEPHEILRVLVLGRERMPEVLGNPAVTAVTFSGGRTGGCRVAKLAGEQGKKVTLHLGAADPFIVLDDADLDQVIPAAVTARFSNAGQSALAAKRFLVDAALADEFVSRLRTVVERDLIYGDPAKDGVQLAPLASHELRDRLHRQVFNSRGMGARVVTGCMPGEGPGAYYQASILDWVGPGMPAYDEELFGPVAAIVRVPGQYEAVQLSNDSAFGLGASVWSGDLRRGQAVARQL
ncbi:MAG TPA: aldehyde dehydrogenase family protein, partial [Gammaproteobacteria bacterium]